MEFRNTYTIIVCVELFTLWPTDCFQLLWFEMYIFTKFYDFKPYIEMCLIQYS